MHELKELVHDRFEELPVSFQESRVLSNDVHDVGRDDSLVVFASLDFAQAKKVLDDLHEESLLGLLIYKIREQSWVGSRLIRRSESM